MAILSPAHLMAFGTITHSYATVEYGIKATLGGILEIPLVEALIVAEPYSAHQLKNVAKSLVKESMLEKSHQDRFIEIVGNWSGYSSIRNQIAHCRWTTGDRPGSVRAVGIDIRSGTAKWIVREDTRDWTAKELGQQSLELADINAALKKLHADAGIQEIMERKDEERKARKEA